MRGQIPIWRSTEDACVLYGKSVINQGLCPLPPQRSVHMISSWGATSERWRDAWGLKGLYKIKELFRNGEGTKIGCYEMHYELCEGTDRKYRCKYIHDNVLSLSDQQETQLSVADDVQASVAVGFSAGLGGSVFALSFWLLRCSRRRQARVAFRNSGSLRT